MYGKEVDDKKAYGQRYMRLSDRKAKNNKDCVTRWSQKRKSYRKMVIIENLVLDNSLCDQLSLANSGQCKDKQILFCVTIRYEIIQCAVN